MFSRRKWLFPQLHDPTCHPNLSPGQFEVCFHMKTVRENTPKPAAGQPVFHKVAENLYRLESSGGYYALVKRTGKQFRRSLKTKDRKLAERRLGDLKGKIGALRISDDAELNFEQLAKYWNGATKHTIASGTLARRNSCIKNLAKFFKGRRSWMSLWKESPLRNSAKSRPKYPVKSKKSG